ncbi:MAG: hypothetical protein WC835_03020 [Candidatus Paceibacterota bacterium]|jgi:hypothetical protein
MKTYALLGIVIALTAVVSVTYLYGVNPGCEFTKCLPLSAEPVTIQALLGQKVSGSDVALTPFEVEGYSKCPMGVQCAWADTVKVRTKIESGLGESVMVFEPNKPIATEAETITLKEVTPAAYSGKSILPSSYQFVFVVAKK